MRQDRFVRVALSLIVLLLGVIALRPIADPKPVHAQPSASDLYIEPGVFPLRAPDGSKELFGKVVVDLSTGRIWGFPTGSKAPYPIVVTESAPPTSKPFLLGTFDLTGMK